MDQPIYSSSLFSKLICSECKKEYSTDQEQTFATCCNKTLLAEYDLKNHNFLENIRDKPNNMWRYFELLPIKNSKNIISLNEGMSPILDFKKSANKIGLHNLFVKDESVNPTGSFKARGISVAVSKAKEFGRDRAIIPTAGNAGGALAAYCAKANIKCTVIMPKQTPDIFKEECILYGAELLLMDGLINECGKKASELNDKNQYFDFSTLKEPYRLEGKKTMGYEIAEQFNFELPDVIIYPAGGGTGLIGIWKAFKELEELGLIKCPLPRMIAVQSSKCSPIQEAIKDPVNWKNNFVPLPSIANGLAVPYPFGMNLILKVLNESDGEICVVDDDEIIKAVKEIAKLEGVIFSPEGAATWKALEKLIETNKVSLSSNILLLNTGSGYKYIDNL